MAPAPGFFRSLSGPWLERCTMRQRQRQSRSQAETETETGADTETETEPEAHTFLSNR
jgi:hypothetical protein